MVVVVAAMVVVGAALVVGGVVVGAAVVVDVVDVAAVVDGGFVVGVGLVAALLLQAETTRLAAAQMTMFRARIIRASWQRNRAVAGSGDVFGLTDAEPARYRCGALSRK